MLFQSGRSKASHPRQLLTQLPDLIQTDTFKVGAKRKTTHQHLFLPKNYTGSPINSVFTPWTSNEVQTHLVTSWGAGSIEDLQLEFLISYYKLYENLMEFQAKRLSKSIYNLDYELLIVNQESETRQLIGYLGLDWDENCLSPQNNKRRFAIASNMQVRQKVYKGSSEQWKKYQPFLNGVFDGLLLS